MTMTLYGGPPTRAVRVQWLLNELRIPYETVWVDVESGEHRSPAFRAINPSAKVPALRHGDLVLSESAAIPLYLAEIHPDSGFIPTDPAQRAQMYQWILFLMTEIEAPLWRVALHEVIYPEHRRIPAEIPNARQDCAQMLAVLEAHLGSREWLVGDGITVADFNAAFTLDWAGFEGLLADCPALRAYVDRLYARPSAPPTIAEGFAALAANR